MRAWLARLFGVLALGVGAVLLVRQTERLGWSEIADQVLGLPFLVVAAAVALTGARFLLWAFRWRRLMASMSGRPGFATTLGVVLAGASVAHALPFGRFPAGLTRARLVASRIGESVATVYGTVLMDQFFVSAAGLSFVAAGGALLVRRGLDVSRMPGGVRTWAVLAVLAAGALVLAPLLDRDRRARGGPEPPSLLARLRRGLLGSVESPAQALAGIVLAALMIAGTIAAELVVLHALGAGLPVDAAVAAVALGGMFGALAGSPGGLGVGEATAIEIYAGFGVSGRAAAAAVLLTRALHLLWVFGAGSACLAALGTGAGRLSAPSPARDPRPARPPRG